MNLHTALTCRCTILLLLILSGLFPLHALEDTPLSVHLIVDNSPALGSVIDEVAAWVSTRLVEQSLRSGGRVTLWSTAPQSGGPSPVYSGAGIGEKEKIIAMLAALPMQEKAPVSAMDIPLKTAAAQRPDGLCYAVLISASMAGFSALLAGPDAGLVKYSRSEEFPGWKAVIVALNIESQVRRAVDELEVGN